MTQDRSLRRVTFTEARIHFHALARTIVETGEGVALTRYGRVVAEIHPYTDCDLPGDGRDSTKAEGN